jgi:hypothetical protein
MWLTFGAPSCRKRFAFLGRRRRLFLLNVILWAACYQTFKNGWKIKN